LKGGGFEQLFISWEVSEEEGSFEKLGDVFDAIRRQFFEDFTRDEVVAGGEFLEKGC
jgi:hypothetical protein